MGRRHRARGFAALLAASALVAACSTSATEPPATIGEVPAPTDQGTLLPVVVDTLGPDSDTVPPGTPFGGEPCSSLDASDFSATVIGGAGSGRLIDAVALAEDTCGYTVRAGGKDFTVLVQMQGAADFAEPASTDEVAEQIDGIGEQAVGVARADAYEVFVQVPNGFFSVSTPDEASARALARAAVARVAGD